MCTVDNASEEEYVQNSERTTYQFESNSLSSTGYVEISENVIHVHFPEKTLVSELPSSNYKNVHIFVNNELCFTFDSLPFYSFYDRVCIMDMFVKAYELYSNMVQGYYFKPYPHSNKPNYSYSSVITKTVIPDVLSLYCLEDHFTTSIHFTIDDYNNVIEIDEMEYPVQFYISIDQTIVFDTAKHLKSLKQIYKNFVVQFLLHKIVHIS